MNVLIQEYRRRIAELDTKIDTINLQLIKFKTRALYDQLETQLRERFDKFNKGTLIKKDKKILQGIKIFPRRTSL